MTSNDRITFEYNGSKFILEFDRDSAVKAERGLNISLAELQSGKTYMVHDLFAAAFIKHHPNIKSGTINELFDNISDKQGLYQALVGMYAEAAGSLLDEPDAGKAISWKVE